ncbi:major facilitator superfamily transporter [Xylariomycetidae sp. FL0641]|nr:major facilitator superfamily transporter [Xylariomycetidae sp. FL0641]
MSANSSNDSGIAQVGSERSGDIEKASVDRATADQGSEKVDPNIADWDGPEDPANPQNWQAKPMNVGVLATITFCSPLASSMFAPGVPLAQNEFNNHDPTLATFVVSIYLLGYVSGPLVLVPLAEIFGRVTIYHIGNIGFIVFTIACAVSSNFNMLIAFRFLSGMISSAPMTVGGGTIADSMPPQQRGFAIMVWSMPVVMGPVIAPVAGGFLAQAEGWRWLFWLIAIIIGAATIAGFLVLRETNPSLLFLSPVCGLLCLYNAFIYAILYLFFSTFTFLFQDVYGFSEGIVGLSYIGMGIGMITGMVLYGTTSDRIIQRLTRKHGVERPKPEYRLPLLNIAAPFISGGLFIYRWTAQYKVQWAVPLLGTLLCGFGFTVIMSCIANYVIDTFTIHAASAMAAITVSRSIFAATFPLFALHMYNSLGWGWGNSLLDFIALAGCAIPPLFWMYWERLRTNPRFQLRL